MKIESAVLRRLGPVPFWRGEKKCLDELQRIYRRASETAAEQLGLSARRPAALPGHRTTDKTADNLL